MAPPHAATETAKPLPPNPKATADGEGRQLATMQLLIQQLAAQLNAPALPAVHPTAAGPAAAGRVVDLQGAGPAEVTADPGPSAAIARSVTALRAAADEMRRWDPAAPSIISSPTTDPQASATEHSPVAQPAAGATAPPSPYGRLALIAEAVTAGRVDVYLDPILALSQRKARHFEVSLRLRTSDDAEIDADEYRTVAAETGLLAQIDQAKLSRTVAVAERLRARGSGGSLFSTLAGESLADDAFLESFADTFAKEEVLGSRLVLAFTQRDVRAFGDAHWEALTTMAEIGLRFSLEDVADLDMDFEKLAGHGFAFVKLDAAVFLGGLPAPGGPIPASDLCRHLSGLGLALIVGHITDERDLARIVGFGVLFGQGALFGAPRPVMVETAPAKAAA